MRDMDVGSIGVSDTAFSEGLFEHFLTSRLALLLCRGLRDQ